MKNFVLIVHAAVQQDLADLLRGLPAVSGFTFTSVEGHSRQTEHDPFLSARDRVVGYVPRIRADILLEEANVESVVAAVRRHPALHGQGIYWLTDIDGHGRL
jgi:nitrogen regulatory protein P-II 1